MRISLARYTQSFTKPAVIVAETLLVPMLAVAIGIWLNPLDPLCINSGFPWLWLAPLVLALRYGPLPGLAGAGMLLLAWLFFADAGWSAGDLPKHYFLGGLVTVMLCGEFSSLWLARTRRAEGMQAYLDQRLDQLTQHYYLLRLSHDRLEQDLIGRPLALRDALQALRELPSGGEQQLSGAAELLRLLAQYCQLEVAALYPMIAGKLADTPVARLGAEFPLNREDALLRHALSRNALTHLQVELPVAVPASDYIVIAPIDAGEEGPVGVLLVKQLPFFALHEDMLQTLNLLLRYYADGLMRQPLVAPITAEVACPAEFAFELMRLTHIRQAMGMDSVLVALEFRPLAGYEDLPMQIQRQQRSLDVCWPIRFAEGSVLFTLMPLAGEGSAEGYIARIEQWVRLQRGDSLEVAGVFTHVRLLENAAPVPLLKQMLSVCHVPDKAWAVRADA
jgi:hypothetical protein